MSDIETRIAAIEEMMTRHCNDGDVAWEKAYHAIQQCALIREGYFTHQEITDGAKDALIAQVDPSQRNAAVQATDDWLHKLATNIAITEAAGKPRCDDWNLPARLIQELGQYRVAGQAI